jgi:putative CocE/NonD family hydrolase
MERRRDESLNWRSSLGKFHNSIPLLLMSIFMTQAIAQSVAESDAVSAKDVERLWNLKVPLRDGVNLSATVYTPAHSSERLPVIFSFTPYVADTFHDRAMYFARHGYVFALVDVRGRGDSEGRFAPFQNDGKDGYDVVEWLAKQPWCNGKVAMWGGSYSGFVQWSILKELPPHLATIVPAASVGIGVDAPFFQGIADPYEEQWAAYTAGKTLNEHVFNDSSFWISKYREMYVNHVPFRDFGKLVGYPSSWFQTVVEHPKLDDYWRTMMPRPLQYERIAIPILTITGEYDDDQIGALHYYAMHMKYGSPEAKEKHFLVIGPWDHPGTRNPKDEVGGLKFGAASMVDLNKLHREWYDWTLKGGPRPEFLRDRVAYYVVGREEWRYAPSLESLERLKRPLYVQSRGDVGDTFHSGTLSEFAPVASAPDTYVYDPLDIRPAEREKENVGNWITDQRYALNLYGSGVVYHSEPFAEDTEVAGTPRLTAWVSMDVRDTDFEVRLYEVLADGSSVLLSSDRLRARYRESIERESLVQADRIVPYQFRTFTFFARRISKGSRLRLVFAASNSIYKQKNYNSGGVVADETAKDARTAHVSLHHDAEHPTTLEFPSAVPVTRKEGGRK